MNAFDFYRRGVRSLFREVVPVLFLSIPVSIQAQLTSATKEVVDDASWQTRRELVRAFDFASGIMRMDTRPLFLTEEVSPNETFSNGAESWALFSGKTLSEQCVRRAVMLAPAVFPHPSTYEGGVPVASKARPAQNGLGSLGLSEPLVALTGNEEPFSNHSP